MAINEEFDEYDATKDWNVCPQIDIASNSVVGDEDCLNLNVYTNKLGSTKIPVIVHIHGGYWAIGGASSNLLGPEYLLKENVVVVTINYRLGALGFLATSDKASKGNFGLKDQILAMRWVQKNIAAFGGDPDNITLLGEDAGAAAVSIHAMSPKSTGLFHKAVVMSGNALCDQHFQPDHQKAAEELAAKLDCSSTKGEDIVECLRRLTHQEIIKATNELFVSFERNYFKLKYYSFSSLLDFVLISTILCTKRRR